jgi:hypothetical protein
MTCQRNSGQHPRKNSGAQASWTRCEEWETGAFQFAHLPVGRRSKGTRA